MIMTIEKTKAVHALVLVFAAFTTMVLPACSATPESWTTKAPLPTTSVFQATGVDGRIYAFGKNETYVYDPTTNAWESKTPMPTPREYFDVAAVNGKIYVIGGVVGWAKIGTNEVYDPATDSWETKQHMPTSRSQIEANAIGNQIYVMGGRTGEAGSTVGYTESYDVSADSWSTKAPMLYPVTSSASAVVNGKIYVIGGQDEYLQNGKNLNTVQIYDPSADQWHLGSPAPSVVWQADAGATTGEFAPKKIYVFGGMAGFAEPLNNNFIYDAENDSWSDGASLPTARYNPTVAVIHDLLYVMGGGVGFPTVTDVNEQYTPSDYVGPVPSSSPTATPTPSPTPAPTLEPTLTPTPTSDDIQILDAMPLLVLSAIVVVAVVVGVLVFFKKRKRS